MFFIYVKNKEKGSDYHLSKAKFEHSIAGDLYGE